MKNLVILFLFCSVSALANGKSGDLICKGKVKDVEITIKYSSFLVASEIELLLLKSDGRKIPFMAQKPRLVKMVDAMKSNGSREEYYYSSDDYIELTLQLAAPNRFEAFYAHRYINNGNLMRLNCKSL